MILTLKLSSIQNIKITTMTQILILIDNNFYENVKIVYQYHTADKLNVTINYGNGFSIVHFNCRSLSQNIERVKESLIELKNIFILFFFLLKISNLYITIKLFTIDTSFQ